MMIEGWGIVALSLLYVGGLFLVAWRGDADASARARTIGPFVYALSLAVYCTSWTFFGSVGLSASTGYDFLPVYIGPILVFMLGWRFVVRVVRLAKSQNITSIADFLAARYGKSQSVAAIVTLIAVAGTIPYMALQLKAVAISIETVIGRTQIELGTMPLDIAFIIALAMAVFAILFGTRHIDATEHQSGLMLAIAAESLVKLAAFIVIGGFVVASFGGIGPILSAIATSEKTQPVFTDGLFSATWPVVILLSSIAIILLPRQFHVTVVENHNDNQIRQARWLFPAYLVAINLFVVPIAAVGLMQLPAGSDADMFVLALPLAAGSNVLTSIAFVGGLSAATAMVIVDSVALAIMVCNGLVVPALLRRAATRFGEREDLAPLLLSVRRIAIFAIIMLGYLFYRLIGQAYGLASIGLLSFAAIAQLAPAFFGGLIWRQATARGAIWGMLGGFTVWAYTLLLPWVVGAGFLSNEIMSEGPFGLAFLRPQALFYLTWLDPLTHGVAWSLAANIAIFFAVSTWWGPEPLEEAQAEVFVLGKVGRARPQPAFGIARSALTVADLQETVARYLGDQRSARAFAEYAERRSITMQPSAQADIGWLRFTEHLLASAIGAASSRLVMSLLMRRTRGASHSALQLLDDASEALQYNRDLLQSAIDQVRHGLGVFDKDMNLICWNRQFSRLLDLPQGLRRVGAPMDEILTFCATRGDFGEGPIPAMVKERVARLSAAQDTYQEHVHGSASDLILEIKSSPMPQGGVVVTFSDITERVAAAEALARANETLERRVRERTSALVTANAALAEAKRRADNANEEKTRFLAATSHDVMQPLNAARLYTTSLGERDLQPEERKLAGNIDASLVAVEEILSALIDISRLDAGRMAPQVTTFALGDVFKQLRVEFAPIAAERGLRLHAVHSSQWVRSDRRLLRRVLQNLLSNALKYTSEGHVLLGCRTRGDRIAIGVLDTGPGIPEDKRELIFKEFQRLDNTAYARGLGLGLSIVDRIATMLDHNVAMRSREGVGTAFWLEVPRAQQPAAQAIEQAKPVARSSSDLAGRRVLCIDNEPAVRDAMLALLGGWGCEVVSIDGSGDALDAIAVAEWRPDMVLADYHLDHHQTGLEALSHLADAFETTLPAIVITADPSREVEQAIRACGHGLLRKPLKAAALRSLMTQRLRSQEVAAAE
ncbi:MAG: NahK/ErcS family hybrid sensor histidine kinase/response regulator [Pseudomonadota bacterium]